MRLLHLVVGIAGVVGFVLTGQYMDRVHDHLRGMDDTTRLLFRSTHLYLLFVSLINVGLGLYLRPRGGWRRWMQSLGSLVLLAAPFVAVAGFCTEPWLTGLARPYTRPLAYGCLAGMLLHLACYSPAEHRCEALSHDDTPVG
jgi:hypothetical protein